MTTFLGDADIVTMMADIGVTFVSGSISTHALVDYVGRDMLVEMGITGVSGRIITATVQTSAVPGVQQGTACTVDGVNWKVRNAQQSADGALTHLLLVTP